MGFTYMRIIYV